MDIVAFVNMTSRAWAVPVLAALHDGVPGRQAPLLVATGASRTAFSQSMEHLLSLGLLERNPGHGHPLRPEFRLTQRGEGAAALAGKIRTVSAEEDQRILRRSWTLPVLVAVHQPSHFNDIQRGLQTITDRALSQALKALEAQDWVVRCVDPVARPPRPTYQSINAGRAISDVLAPEISFG